MGIIRKDYILDRWVYYASKRSKRPHEFRSEEIKSSGKNCLFCPTNENLTPPEIGRVEYKGSWKIRWFLNKYPAVDSKKNIMKKNSFFKKKKFFFWERCLRSSWNYSRDEPPQVAAGGSSCRAHKGASGSLQVQNKNLKQNKWNQVRADFQE